jgi:hypothetical protein
LLLIVFVCFYILLKCVAFYIYFYKIFHFGKTVDKALNEKILISVVFNFFKWASFAEEFEFNFPFVLYHYFSFVENFTLFSIYYFYSTRSQQIQLLFASISFGTFWLGIFIEIFYWKFCLCCTRKRDPVVQENMEIICFVYEIDPSCINVRAFCSGAYHKSKSAHINT